MHHFFIIRKTLAGRKLHLRRCFKWRYLTYTSQHLSFGMGSFTGFDKHSHLTTSTAIEIWNSVISPKASPSLPLSPCSHPSPNPKPQKAPVPIVLPRPEHHLSGITGYTLFWGGLHAWHAGVHLCAWFSVAELVTQRVDGPRFIWSFAGWRSFGLFPVWSNYE